MKKLMLILLVSLLVTESALAQDVTGPSGTTAGTGVYRVLDYGARGTGTADDTAGIYCECARNLTLRNTRVVWAERLTDDYGPALESRHVEDLQLDHFTGHSAHLGKSPDKIVE